MRKALRALAVAFPIGFLGTGAVIWHIATSTPSTDVLPVPQALISLNSKNGQELLSESRYVADYDELISNFESQSRRAYCGVASAVTVINSVRPSKPRVTQSTFFTESVRKVRGEVQVTFAGMTLAELADLLRAHGLEATAHHADATSLASFRSIAQSNLRSDGDFLLVNYQRASLDQGEIGHISPIAAYNADTDRFLILDVAAYKYPPVWVSAEALWQAMNTVDASSGRTRGFVVVREGAPIGTPRRRLRAANWRQKAECPSLAGVAICRLGKANPPCGFWDVFVLYLFTVHGSEPAFMRLGDERAVHVIPQPPDLGAESCGLKEVSRPSSVGAA